MAPALPPPQTTIHHHGTSWPAIIVVSVLCGLVSLPVLFWFISLLFGFLGSRNPSREAAFWILSLLVIPPAAWLLRWFIVGLIDSWRGHSVEMAREITRQVELQLLGAQTTLDPGRYNEDDFNFARIVLACMMQAYQWLEKNQCSTFPARWRPWSLASARDTAVACKIKLTQERANAVSKWLYERGVIDDPDRGQITRAFPNLSSVRALLDNEFGKPITMIAPPLRDNRGFRFTD